MSHDPLFPPLAQAARAREYPDDPATLDRLLRWMDAVLEANRQVNLTAAKSREQALDGLLLSALAVTRAVDSPPAIVVDLGTGNGLPGIAAALAWPDAQVVLLERRHKKGEAVARLLATQGVANAEVIVADGRELLRECPALAGAVDLVTVRAVGPLGATTEVAAPWLAPGGRIAHWKGRALADDELETGRRTASRLGLGPLVVLRFEDRAGPAHLVCYERKGEG